MRQIDAKRNILLQKLSKKAYSQPLNHPHQLYRKGERVTLEPSNPKYEPIPLMPKSVQVQGVVGCIPLLQKKYLAIGNRGYRNEVRLRGLNVSVLQAGVSFV